jgi:hypothetical protein
MLPKVLGNPPRVSPSVDEAGLALVVGFVFRCRDASGSEFNGPIVCSVDVRHVDIHRTYSGLDVNWQFAGFDPDEGIAHLDQRWAFAVQLEYRTFEGSLDEFGEVFGPVKVGSNGAEAFVDR